MTEFGEDLSKLLAAQDAADAEKRAKRDKAFEAFKKKENGETSAGQTADEAADDKVPVAIAEEPVVLKVGRIVKKSETGIGNSAEKLASKEVGKEKNFGRKLDSAKYGMALDRAMQLVSKLHDNQDVSKRKNPKVFYTEVVEKAIKESQSVPDRNNGTETLAEGLMFQTLAAKLKKNYDEKFKEPGDFGTLEVSIYNAQGSDLEEDQSVVAIVECSTPNSMAKEKFYLTTFGYRRDIRNDEPERSSVINNYHNLGVSSVGMPMPFDGLDDDDMKTSIKSALANKIGSKVADAMLSSFKRKEVFA